MTERLTVAAAAALLFFSPVVPADEHGDAISYYPVETFTCEYRDGADASDLDKVVDAWTEFSDDQGVDTYFAVTLVPHYHGADTFDVGWLGSWSSGEAMGRGTDMWITEGRDMAERFAEVLHCETHENFVSGELKAPPSDTPPDTVVLTFSDCKMRDGRTEEDLMSGMKAFVAYQEEQDIPGGLWMMWPVFGGGDADYDFKLVEGYPDHATLGRVYDWYMGGEYRKWEELIGANVSCDVGRVYNGTVRRRMAGE